MWAKISSAWRSISSVSSSTNHDPPRGSATCTTPDSSAITCCVRRARRAACSVGSASASSKASVCRLCVPPSTPASASMATRTRFTSGCWAVRDTPAVCVWKRSWVERPSVGAVTVAHPMGPDAAGGTVLGDLLEEVAVGIEEEAQPRGELVDRHARRHGRLDVGEPVGQGEGQLLGRRRACFTDVVARDRDRVPPWHLRRAEPHDVGHQAHRGPRREHVLLLRLVLLQDVVLQRARQPGPLDPGTVGHADVHGQEGRRGRVDRHRRRDATEVDVGEEPLHVGLRVHGHPGPADLAPGQGVVGVAPEERGHVEGRRQPVTTGPQQFLEALVGVGRRPESGELAHRPETRAVHGGVRPPGVGELSRELRLVRPVDRLERHARHRLETCRRGAANGRRPPARSLGLPWPARLLQRQSIFQGRPTSARSTPLLVAPRLCKALPACEHRQDRAHDVVPAEASSGVRPRPGTRSRAAT